MAGGVGWDHLVCVIMTHSVQKSICDFHLKKMLTKSPVPNARAAIFKNADFS